MKKTLYLLVSCCMEQSRFEILKTVIDSIKSEQSSKNIDIEDDLVVFDNGSTYPGTVELLTSNFTRNVHVADMNMGYWSALDWLMHAPWAYNYDYVYVIESDHVQFALEKIETCTRALDMHPELGSVRTQEYSVSDRHLYDKTLQRPDGRRYAWVSHVNVVTKKDVTLTALPDVEGVYDTNFLTCLHSVNRLSALRDVFLLLRQMNGFSEHDFQRLYHKLYPRIGLLDGGIFHAKLGFTLDNPGSLSGSWSTNVSQFGYKETRVDKILQYKNVMRLS